MRGALVCLLLALPAYADNAPHKEGQYGGVTPGEAQPRDPPGKPARPRHPPPRGALTWIGFAAKDGGAEVFFQSVAPFEISQRVEGPALIVQLGLSRLGHNTWRQIDTRFFDNPLAGIVARPISAAHSRDRRGHAGGIEARITFKNAGEVKEATVRTATEPDGMFYTYLTFPRGSEPAVDAASPEPAQEPDDDTAPPPSKP